MDAIVDSFINSLKNYYGIDWIAMVATFLSIHNLSNKRKSGFIYGLIAAFFWTIFNLFVESYAGILANVVFAAMNIRGFIKWKHETQAANVPE